MPIRGYAFYPTAKPNVDPLLLDVLNEANKLTRRGVEGCNIGGMTACHVKESSIRRPIKTTLPIHRCYL